MAPLSPDYLTAIATQLGSVSAFFGGFAATMLALFLTVGESREVRWSLLMDRQSPPYRSLSQ